MNRKLRKKSARDPTSALARSITWAGSKQTYFTARLLVDRDLVDDCYRAYAYFRWADDIVDAGHATAAPNDERLAFIQGQKALIDRCYDGDYPKDLSPEEEMVAVLIRNDRERHCGLTSFIYNFLAILEFDASRRGRLISQEELTWYSNCLSRAVTDGIHYFIGHGHPAPLTDNRYRAVFAAHITHMLRDMVVDIADGYWNIPAEYIQANGIQAWETKSPAFRAWVQRRVQMARQHLRAGRLYLNGLRVLRRKIAGVWYCARYDSVLDAMERDGYLLRSEYRRTIFDWLRIGWLGLSVILRHLARPIFARRHLPEHFPGNVSEVTEKPIGS